MPLTLNAEKIKQEALDQAFEKLHTEPEIAEILLNQFLKTFPEDKKGLWLYGLVQHKLENYQKAIELYEMVLKEDPENASVLNDLALSYSGSDEVEKAKDILEKAVNLDPRPDFYNNLAVQWRMLGNFEKAIEITKKCIEMNPKEPRFWCNLAGIYGELKMMDDCIHCCRSAIAQDPEFNSAHIDLAFSLLMTGDLKEGFDEYEWRLKSFRQLSHYREAYDQNKRWKGIKEQSIEGKRVIVVFEQGHGDAIHFIRYIKKLKDLGAYVIVHGYPTLKNIVERIEGVDESFYRDIINHVGEEIPEHDYHFPILSIMPLIDCWEISGEPYIKPPCIFDIKKESDYKKTFNIGVCWAGNPAHPNDRGRSIPLKEFKPLYEMNNVKLFSLQLDLRSHKHRFFKDPVDYQKDCQDLKIVDMRKFIQCFDDTLVIANGLDFIVSADTALIHLCGAAGIPCAVLTPYGADWRWGLTGNTTEWYNSLMLFRQQNPDDWSSVFQDVIHYLTQSTQEKLVQLQMERNKK